MFLKSLKIENGNSVIRDIPFQKGINIIVDETKTANKTESGNNVGKTTVLKLIHYCLGADGKSIYSDTEFKNLKTKTLVENFLKDNNIIITLKVIEDIDDDNSAQFTIKRNFLSRTKKIQEIDGIKYNDTNFDLKLKELFFDTDVVKPTFKQLVSKNIRDEKNRLVNTIKVLSQFTTDTEYEILYLFLLGIDVASLEKKQSYEKQIRDEGKIQNRLKESGSLSRTTQSLSVVNRTITELENQKNTFGESKDIETDLASLNKVRSKINLVTSEIGSLKMRKELIEESKSEIEGDYVKIDTDRIKTIYENAKKFIPNLHVTFENTVSFHTDMLKEKIAFITQELPTVDERLKKLDETLKELVKKEGGLSSIFGKGTGLQKVLLDLNKNYETKGELNELKKLWDKSVKNLDEAQDNLDKINNIILNEDGLIAERVSSFNKYFSQLSKDLYDERFILSADNENGVYKLTIANLDGGLGTGKKKGQIAAFDFAYIRFADALKIKCLHFILHDQIENIHDNQITSMLNDVVADTNCQYIIPVLRDKLPKEINLSKSEVLKLSQDDKLFKIESFEKENQIIID